MIRISLIALSVYGYGGDAFDDMRPDVLDGPVRAFHADVNQTAHETAWMLSVLNDAREMRHLEVLADDLAEIVRQI